MSDDLIERLRECAECKSSEAWGRLDGGQDLCIGAALATEAADELARLHTQLGLQKAMVQEERRLRIRREAELDSLRAEVERLRAALSDERAHADALAEAVEMFATDRNWLQGGPFDPCSPSFTGTSMASAVAKQHRARRQG
ncbi:hypothetical protein ACNKFW_15650 (plasmid) [Paracoccus sp. TD-10]|uniref:hypothetical protein n=1 Tax=Paracoccus sp. TD-10 TaxID=3395918 RepID=UPI003AAAA3CF